MASADEAKDAFNSLALDDAASEGKKALGRLLEGSSTAWIEFGWDRSGDMARPEVLPTVKVTSPFVLTSESRVVEKDDESDNRDEPLKELIW